MSVTPRLRMFAGPNGSGKSTIINGLIERFPDIFGKMIFLNADNLEKDLTVKQFLDLNDYDKRIVSTDILKILKKINNISLGSDVTTNGNQIDITTSKIDSYLAANILEYIREQFLLFKINFIFETVMSHESKVEFLKRAQQLGYKTYLYFITTEDPTINVNRVQYREAQGGHSVPINKIIDRYERSMNLLIDAIENANRAFLFDNSTQSLNEYDNSSYVCEIATGDLIINRDLQKCVFKKNNCFRPNIKRLNLKKRKLNVRYKLPIWLGKYILNKVEESD